MNLQTGEHKPYMKPNNTPLYAQTKQLPTKHHQKHPRKHQQKAKLHINQQKHIQTRSTQRAQTSLAEADHYSHIAHCKNVEPWL